MISLSIIIWLCPSYAARFSSALHNFIIYSKTSFTWQDTIIINQVSVHLNASTVWANYQLYLLNIISRQLIDVHLTLINTLYKFLHHAPAILMPIHISPRLEKYSHTAPNFPTVLQLFPRAQDSSRGSFDGSRPDSEDSLDRADAGYLPSRPATLDRRPKSR